MWLDTLKEWAQHTKTEFMCKGTSENDITDVILVNSSFTPKMKNEVAGIIQSGIRFDFKEGLKFSTMENVVRGCLICGFLPAIPNIDDKRHCQMKLYGPPLDAESLAKFSEVVDAILIEDGFLKSWEIYINEKRVSSNSPQSDAPIEIEDHKEPIVPDDITNLKIELGKCESVDDFLKNM